MKNMKQRMGDIKLEGVLFYIGGKKILLSDEFTFGMRPECREEVNREYIWVKKASGRKTTACHPGWVEMR